MNNDYKTLMRHEESGPPDPQVKPICKEYPECEGCPYPAHGFVCWRERCVRKEVERIHTRDGEEKK